MRCLHCGNEVSLLHKLTDAQFCSAEHRQTFYDDQQRLILQRLQASAGRFNRYRRGAAPAPAPVVSAPAEAAAPAPIAAFCAQTTPNVTTRAFSLLMMSPLDADGSLVTPPASKSSIGSGEIRLSAPVFDIPWAKYNSGLLSFDSIVPVSSVEQIVASLRLPAPIRDWVALSASRLVAVRHPQALARPLAFAPAAIEPGWDLLSVAPDLNTPRLRRSIGPSSVVLRGIRTVDILAPRIANSRFAALIEAPSEILVAPPAVSWNALQLHSATRQRGMAFLDRVFRMRPRSGVLAKEIADYTPIAARAEVCSAPDPLSSSSKSLSIDIAVGLSKSDRFFRARPRGGVLPDSIAPFTGIDAVTTASELVQAPVIPLNARSTEAARVRSASTAASLAGTPALFAGPEYHNIGACWTGDALAAPLKPSRTGFSQTQTFEPPAIDRMFRMRPRSGVADPKIGGLVVSAGDEPFQGALALPAIAARQNFSPRTVRKFAIGRPRGPVPGATAALEQVSLGVLAVEPTAAAIVASAQTPVAVCEPVQVNRLYRFRSRGPVASGLCAPYDQVAPGQIGFVSQSSYPAFDPADADLSPAISSRLFRMRPRNAVASAGAGELSSSRSEFEPLISTPAVLGMTVTACAPDMVTKPFRVRPRAGITSSRTSAFEQIRAENQPLASRGIWPSSKTGVGGNLVPPAIDRVYRMRARAGVAGGAELMRIGVIPQEFPARPAPLYVAVAECAPALVVRVCRARPRGPVDVETPLFHIGAAPLPVDLDLLRSTYPLGRGVEPSPAFMNRVYRARPRLPLDDARTQTASIRFKHVAAQEPDALLPALPASILEVPEPAQLEKLYRMRPRSGKQGAPDALPIECAPVNGSGAPDAYSGTAGAIAGTSARDALKKLSQNWKTTPTNLKAMVMVLPLLVCVSLLPLGGNESSVAKASTVEAGPLQTAVSAEFDRVGREIRGRAAIAVEEDFRSGLDRWGGAEGWRDTWSIHPSGWVAPGKLAVLTPSIELKDYRLEFSGQIVSKALGFVVRAADTSNYHAVKFKLSARGNNVPTMTVVRTTVIDGKELTRKETTVPMPVTKDTVYQVSVDVNDQYFTLMIRDKVVDFWSDAQLKSGGIGFFTEKGEQALIHDIKVRHQYDALGRLVAAALPAER